MRKLNHKKSKQNLDGIELLLKVTGCQSLRQLKSGQWVAEYGFFTDKGDLKVTMDSYGETATDALMDLEVNLRCTVE